MNILITGNLFSIATSLAKKLAKENNRVVLASEESKDLEIDINNVIVHALNPVETLFQDALSSYKFEAVIYIATREEQIRSDGELNGHQLDGLKNTLELCKKEHVKRFVYISSTEIYGVMNDTNEGILPQPASINGYTLLAGEQYCRLYRDEFGLPAIIVRIPYVYGNDEKAGYLKQLIQDCKDQSHVVVPGGADRVCSFLHVDDISDFLIRILDEEYSSSALTVNLSPSTTITNFRITELLQKHFPLTNFTFDEERKLYTRPVMVSVAKKMFDWTDLHNVDSEFAEYIDSLDVEKVSIQTSFLRLRP